MSALADCALQRRFARGSFEELVLEGGRVRWNRVENLVVESAKSASFDPSQLWMVVDWVLGAPGAGIRKPLAAEMARLIDSAVAGARMCLHLPSARIGLVFC